MPVMTDTPLTFDILTEIATALGADWQARRVCDHDGEQASDRDARELLVYVGADPDLAGAYVAGRWGHYRSEGKWQFDGGTLTMQGEVYDALGRDDWQRYNASMNVTPTKTPVQIARELERRVLAEFLPMYRKARKTQRETTARIAADNTLAQNLAWHLAGSRAVPAKGKSYEAQVVTPSGYPDLRVSHQAVYAERLSMTPAQAREFMMLLADWQDAARAAQKEQAPA